MNGSENKRGVGVKIPGCTHHMSLKKNLKVPTDVSHSTSAKYENIIVSSITIPSFQADVWVNNPRFSSNPSLL